MDKQPTCLVVMGPYRSGTSLLSQILARLGAHFGGWQSLHPGPNRLNPGGYYQRPEIVLVNTRLIKSAGASLGHPSSPVDTCRLADRTLLDGIDLSWSREHPVWAMKDPRFCVTLKLWIDAGKLDPGCTRIIRVRRSERSAANSVLRHYEVRNFCGCDPEVALQMTRSYDEAAEWHVRSLGLKACEMDYEFLVANRRQGIRELAGFLDIDDGNLIDQCVQLIGKRRALLRHYLRKFRHRQFVWDGVVKTIGAWRRPSDD